MVAIAQQHQGISSRTAKRFAITLLVLALFLDTFISRVTGLPLRLMLDGVVVVIAGAILIEAYVRQRIRALHLILFASIGLFTIISLLGGLEPSLPSSIISAVIFSKFLIVFFLAPSVKLSDLRLALFVLAVVHTAGIAANLAIPEFFIAYMPDVTYEIDTSRLMGFSLNANRSAAVSTILIIYFLFFERRLVLATLFLVMLLLSDSRSLIVVTAILIGYFFLRSNAALPLRLLSVVLVIGLISLAAVAGRSIDETAYVIEQTVYGDLRYIRAAMLAGGYNLATAFYPFGVGGGLYGSSMSAGSEAYRLVGIAHWSTVEDMTGVFDSGIGAILGEYGWLGLAVYSVLLFLVLKNAYGRRVPIYVALLMFGLVIFMSFARTVASDFFFSFFFLFLYVAVLTKHYQNQDRRARRVSSIS